MSDRPEKKTKASFEGGESTLDPLERHTFMIRKSTIKALEDIVYKRKDKSNKTNKSELVRDALKLLLKQV